MVWGLALVLAAILLRGGEQKSESRIFWFGVILGGAYEYVCSAVTELLFGTVFWDYSGFKFNLGGRINLLYCFFWGIAAVTWIRYGYPLVAKGMKAVKRRIRPWMTALLAVFMAVNLVTSALALARYDARTSGAAPANAVDVLLDEHFDNARMERIYPNAKKVEKAEINARFCLRFAGKTGIILFGLKGEILYADPCIIVYRGPALPHQGRATGSWTVQPASPAASRCRSCSSVPRWCPSAPPCLRSWSPPPRP